MNIEELQRRIHEITNILSVYVQEAKDIESKRTALENSGFVQTERETRLNLLQTKITKSEQDLIAQRNYIDEQVTRNSKILEGITKEREFLKIDAAKKDAFDRDSAYVAVREKTLETKLIAFEKEKALIKKQEAATTELIEILDAREKRIKAREAHLQMLSTA